MTSTTDAEVAARYGVSVDEEAEGIAEPWNTDGGNIRPIAAVSEWTGKAAAWLVLPLMAVLAVEALRRRIFGASFIWAQDVAYFLYATHFLLGSAFTLKRSGHIRTDFSYRKWKPRTQATADFIIYVFLFIPALVVALWVSGEFAWEAFERREKVIRSAWQDGPLWVLLMVLPLGLALWMMQSISEAVKSWNVMRSGEWQPPVAKSARIDHSDSDSDSGSGSGSATHTDGGADVSSGTDPKSDEPVGHGEGHGELDDGSLDGDVVEGQEPPSGN